MEGQIDDIASNFTEIFKEILKTFRKSRILKETTTSSIYALTESLNYITPDNYEHVQDENLSTLYDYNNTPSKFAGQEATAYSSYPPEVLWFGAICCILFAIFGTTGNFISMLALYRCKRLRNATTAFIINLCVADMLYCCFTMPLTAVTFIDRNWRNGDALCKLFAMVKFSNGIVSIFTVVAITINRYILIVHPRIYKTMYSTRNTAIGIACLWIFPLSLITLPLFDVWGTLIYNPRVGDCGVNNLNGKSPRALIFVIIIVLPSIFFIACYLKIYLVVKRSVGNFPKQDDCKMQEIKGTTAEGAPKSGSSQRTSVRVELRDKKEFRVLRIALVLFLMYMISIFPISLIKLFRKERALPVMNVLGYIFYFSSSVVNPIIYIAMSREYRTAYKELFTSKICCN